LAQVSVADPPPLRRGSATSPFSGRPSPCGTSYWAWHKGKSLPRWVSASRGCHRSNMMKWRPT